MNYLAHLYLAGDDPEIIIGNFIADHVKGSKIFDYSPEIQKGIRMHRYVDHYTDHHPIVKQSITRLRPHFHKYAGVVVDMYYDHFLSANWNEYSAISLNEFSKSRFEVLNSQKEILPERSQRLLYYMQKQNWLQSYGTFEGLQQAFNGIAQRTRFFSNLEQSVNMLKKYYPLFETEFENYIIELQHVIKYF